MSQWINKLVCFVYGFEEYHPKLPKKHLFNRLLCRILGHKGWYTVPVTKEYFLTAKMPVEYCARCGEYLGKWWVK